MRVAKTFNASASYEFLYHVRGDEHLFAVVDVHQGTGMSVLQRVDGQGSLRFEMILEPNGGIMFRCWNEDRLRQPAQWDFSRTGNGFAHFANSVISIFLLILGNEL